MTENPDSPVEVEENPFLPKQGRPPIQKRGPKKITLERFTKAAEDSGGVIQVIADRLRVNRSTVMDFLKFDPNAAAILLDEKERILDTAETSLFRHISADQPWATKFLLSTLGKKRGYVESQQNILIANNNGPNFDGLAKLFGENKDETSINRD